jgi:hypothetical protein
MRNSNGLPSTQAVLFRHGWGRARTSLGPAAPRASTGTTTATTAMPHLLKLLVVAVAHCSGRGTQSVVPQARAAGAVRHKATNTFALHARSDIPSKVCASVCASQGAGSGALTCGHQVENCASVFTQDTQQHTKRGGGVHTCEN